MSTTVLATKLFAPSRRDRLVVRSRLSEELDRSLADDRRLTLVSAPAGFGKTTLVSEWIDSLAEHQVNTAWLSLDSGDNDLSRLLTHLVVALNRCGLDIDPEQMAPLAAGDSAAFLTNLVNEVVAAGAAQPGERWLVVLDDYHVIESPAVHEAISFLLDNLPRQLHLALVTRSDPPLQLARLRSRGQLIELRAADLRFTPAEAREFLNHVMGLELTVAEVEALEERTEGWIAGLQLAALSLRNTPTRDETANFIAAFTGSNRFVIDYLLDEVLARLSPEALDFLLHTSILERLTGPLCDAVIVGADSASTLIELERNNVFVVALDTERSWFRYHHLFADVLRARLLADQPEIVPSLHARASDWYAVHDLTSDAVHHALAGGDPARAANLIEQAIPRTRRARQDATLLTWIRSLPETVVRRSPVLCNLSAWSMMLAGDLVAMEARLDDAEAALAAGRDDPALAATWADTEDLRSAPAAVFVYRAALAQAHGDVTGTIGHARHALTLAAPDDHFVRGAAGGLLGLASWAAGDVHLALSTFTNAVQSLHDAGNLVDELDTSVILGDMWMTAGRPGEARRVYEQALSAAARGTPHVRVTADLHVGLADLDLQRNNIAGAEGHLDRAKVLGERGSITEHRFGWYVTAAKVRAAAGDHATAVHLLDEAEALYRPGAYPDIRPIPAVRARVHIGAGDLEAAQRWARDHEASLTSELAFLTEYEHLTLVRLHLVEHRLTPNSDTVRGRAAPIEDVLQSVRDLAAAAESKREGSALEIGVLHALTLQLMGDRDAAVEELDRALVTAPEPDHYVRLFLDEGAPMLDLLRDAADPRREGLEAARPHAVRLLDAARGAGDSDASSDAAHTTAGGSDALVDSLSERELEVLRLLDSDLTGPEIARQMYVSLNTLRTHTKRIYTKLDVTNRSAAVRRGRELGLF